MSIPPNAVKVCDLTNGRIVFDAESIVVVDRNDQIHISLTDMTDTVHEFPVDIVDGESRFDRTAFPQPLRSFRVFRATDGHTVFEAHNLFPSTDREFETQFKSHRDRSGDRHVDYFVASQIFDQFTGQEGYRISASVVAAYKAIELLDTAYLDAAEKMLLRSLSAIPTVKLARSTRNNREHLHISVLCALYHVHLALGNSREFLRTLLVLKGLLEDQAFQSYYNLAYNGALSLRLLTLLHLAAGQQSEARNTATLSFNVFKLASRDADENLAHFKELRYVHDNTLESMRIARRVNEVTDSLIDKTLRGCLRVSADEHQKSFTEMRDTFMRATTEVPGTPVPS